ncbi:MAG: RluA family pseudouridine synthase [Planctomycetota bacterium]|nr:RluA family pseudouridine synthase [Planctomycetota bacterium]
MSGLKVLYVDNHLLMVLKPACLPIVPDSSGDESLLDQARAWVKKEYSKPGNVFLGVVHRLDRPVSGVVCFARTSKAASRLSEAWRSNTVFKTYQGLGVGDVLEDSGHLTQWLIKDRERNVVRVVTAETTGAKKAETKWKILRREKGKVLFELIPVTGRAHQLRLAAATLGAPLEGDIKYGATKALPDRSIALHAGELEVPHPTKDDRVAVKAVAPF